LLEVTNVGAEVPPTGTVVVVVVVEVVVGAAAIVKETVDVAVPNVEPVAVMVTELVDAADGVPEITPVDAFNDKPAGRVPVVTAYVTDP
jgi:hypothetical protein